MGLVGLCAVEGWLGGGGCGYGGVVGGVAL